jgi:serine/threonine-protein kinase
MAWLYHRGMPDPHDLVQADTLADETKVGRGGAVDRELQAPDSNDERYREEGQLGRGGMGIVSAYYDRRIGRHVACKDLRRDILDDAQSRTRFLREARVQGRLEHPAIVPVYDIGARPDGSPYFTMKNVRGVTLADVIAQLGRGEVDERYAPRRLLSAFSRICLAVEYAHERGILHRDLKPANLILGEYGEVYVLDWGLAKVIGDNDLPLSSPGAMPSPDTTQADALLGTPGYMAPEQIEDPSRVGPAADVYSLAAILFEILALEPLHARGYEALTSTRDGVEARPSVRAPSRNTPPELESALVRATSLDPSTRGSPRELSDLIERYLEGERDLELRRAKAAAHATAAERAVVAAEGSEPAALAARREAMQEINAALVLDPSNTRAMATMVEILTTPLSSPPPELVSEVERQFRRDLQWISAIGAITYLSLVGFLGFVWWMGIRQPAVVAVFFSTMALSGVLSVIVSRSKEPNLVLVGIAVLASAIGFGFGSRFASPLLIIPCAATINGTGYAVFLSKRGRALVMLVSSGSFLVPLALELAGVLSPTFTFEGGHLQILPIALDLPATPTIALITAASATSTFLGSIIIGNIRDRLADAETRIFMYAWHLRELVPSEVRAKADPLKITRRSRTDAR